MLRREGMTMRRRWTTLIAALALPLAACGGDSGGSPPPTATPSPSPTPVPTPTPIASPTPTPVSPYPVGLSQGAIQVDGVQRSFLVYQPAATSRPRAIVLVLHGGTGSGQQAATLAISPQAVFRTVADREGFLVVFPNGLDNNWNDCRGDAPALRNTGDDVAFFDALLARLDGELGLSARQHFLSGTSNGAMMSMRYAIERPARVAAIAVSSGSLAAVPKAGACAAGPVTPVPILLTHGTLDPLVRYAGGCVAEPLTTGCSQGSVIGAEATRDRWRTANGVSTTAAAIATVDPTPDDGGPAVQHRYLGTTPVEWWRLDGAGHSPPSRTVFLARDTAGTQNRDVEFAEIAWTFFAAHLP